MSNKIKLKPRKVTVFRKIINPFNKINNQMTEEEKKASGRVYFTCEDQEGGGFKISSNNMWENELPNLMMTVDADETYKEYCMGLMKQVVITLLQQGPREMDGHFALEEYPNGPLKYIFDFEDGESDGTIVIKPFIDDGHEVTYNRKHYVFDGETKKWKEIEES